jgi:hypothetical protein
MLLNPFVILLFASFSSFARRKRRRGWAAAQIGIKNLAAPDFIKVIVSASVLDYNG